MDTYLYVTFFPFEMKLSGGSPELMEVMTTMAVVFPFLLLKTTEKRLIVVMVTMMTMTTMMMLRTMVG